MAMEPGLDLVPENSGTGAETLVAIFGYYSIGVSVSDSSRDLGRRVGSALW